MRSSFIRAALAAGLAGLAGCGPGAYRAVEPTAGATPDVRVVVWSTGSEVQVVALEGSAPFRTSLESSLKRGDALEAWFFHYSLNALVAAYPGLRGKTPAEAVGLLAPALETGATAPPLPAEVLHVRVASGAKADVVPETRRWEDWIAALQPSVQGGLRAFDFHPPAGPDTGCPTFTVRVVAGPSDGEFSAAAAPTDDTAVLGGPGSGAAMRLALVRGAMLVPLDPDPMLPGNPSSLASDALTHTLYGTNKERAGGSNLLRLDRTGHRLPAPILALDSPEGLSIGKDGSIVVFGGDKLFDLSAGSTVSRQRTDYRGGAPLSIHVSRRDRIAVADGVAIYYFDGMSWRREHAMGILERVSAVGGDDDVLVAVGDLALVLVRDEAGGLWNPLEPAPGGHLLNAVAGLGGGRFLVAGTVNASLWTGVRWCPIDTRVSSLFTGAAATPNRKSVFLIGSQSVAHDEAHPAVVRVDIGQ